MNLFLKLNGKRKKLVNLKRTLAYFNYYCVICAAHFTLHNLRNK